MKMQRFQIGSRMSPAAVLRSISPWRGNAVARVMAGYGIHDRARAANRLLLSLWLSLPFAFLLSSDWIGVLVIWHALSASIRLLQNSANRVGATVSAPSNGIQGGYGVH